MADEVTVSVRLGDGSGAALERLREYIRAQVGPGVLVKNADVVRWCVWTCDNMVAAGSAPVSAEQGEDLAGK